MGIPDYLELKAGVPLKVLSEQLGHASIAITADIYTDVYPELRADAARKLTTCWRRPSTEPEA